MKINLAELDSMVMKLLLTEYTREESELIRDVLMFGEITGKASHGLIRLINKDSGVFIHGHKRRKPKYDRRSAISTVIEGHFNPGMLIAQRAKEEVITLATKNGFGIVGTKGSVNTTGAVAYYCMDIAKHGFIGIIFTQSSPRSRPLVAAFGTLKPVFGTNPISFGIPHTPDPIILDMSTSATTFGDISHAALKGQKLPEYVAIDENGDMTTDPQKALKGAVLPFDRSYKGSGLAFMTEIIGSVLPGASFSGLFPEKGQGNVFMAFKPDLLSDRKAFQLRVKKLMKHLRSIPTKTGKIRLPGEYTMQLYNKAMKEKKIEIEDKTYNLILEQI